MGKELSGCLYKYTVGGDMIVTTEPALLHGVMAGSAGTGDFTVVDGTAKVVYVRITAAIQTKNYMFDTPVECANGIKTSGGIGEITILYSPA